MTENETPDVDPTDELPEGVEVVVDAMTGEVTTMWGFHKSFVTGRMVNGS